MTVYGFSEERLSTKKPIAGEGGEHTEQTEKNGTDGSCGVICPCLCFRLFRPLPFVLYDLFPVHAATLQDG